MIVRKSYCTRLLNRSWGGIAKGTIIVQRVTSIAGDGFLNVAKSGIRTPGALQNCDIWLATQKRKETRVGVETSADAIIWMDRDLIATLGETDIITIGGTIQGGNVTGGTDFRIKNIDAYDSIIGDKAKVELARL
ncbi:MAG: hypothetical protein EPN93_17460 [Spirochaetes bacterium]|nr:MAG: hypothetical protein EPN93_17460 [Spirochaetota bacterium]